MASETMRIRRGGEVVHSYADRRGLSEEDTDSGKTLTELLCDVFSWAEEGPFLDSLHEAREIHGKQAEREGRRGA